MKKGIFHLSAILENEQNVLSRTEMIMSGLMLIMEASQAEADITEIAVPWYRFYLTTFRNIAQKSLNAKATQDYFEVLVDDMKDWLIRNDIEVM